MNPYGTINQWSFQLCLKWILQFIRGGGGWLFFITLGRVVDDMPWRLAWSRHPIPRTNPEEAQVNRSRLSSTGCGNKGA